MITDKDPVGSSKPLQNKNYHLPKRLFASIKYKQASNKKGKVFF